jgi:hypothetical protein
MVDDEGSACPYVVRGESSVTDDGFRHARGAVFFAAVFFTAATSST